MKILIGAVTMLGLSSIALAADEADAPAEDAKEAAVDCSTLDDAEAKAGCEAAKAAADKAAADKAAADEASDEKGGKGKGLKKSENNKMEKFDEE